ncbi:MurR/RpiR family transcriptional regulator [Cohaesibacter celericrescens]|uniref:MurR/RpiR family transcriptional regulator n=1 Tax=Cohaesibacter celericrescens TaxID=2067669 RepID=A0A2N5XNR1_9HYPH|nr:MurR/RpiR family transcriptional regulator [Cohaesibacter celericrescens]PLW76115.1 hypothetical protein C0081_14440 [Cohaesibacter celericrescens]
MEGSSQTPPKSDVSDGPVIDIFQRMVATARSGDQTMSALAKWILNHQDATRKLTISELANQTDVSQTTVFRFCKLLGLKGYKDLRLALAEGHGLALGTQLAGEAGLSDGGLDHSLKSIMLRVVEANVEQLLRTARIVSHEALTEVVNLLLDASQIQIVGFGSSAPIAIDACRRLLSLGYTASAHSDPHILAVVTANAKPGTVFVGISNSGRTRDLIDCFTTLGKRGVKRVLLTSDPDAVGTKQADLVLVSAVRRMPPSLDVIGTRVSQLAIIEALCVALAEKDPRASSAVCDTGQLDAEIAKKRLPQAAQRNRGKQEE